MIDTELYRRLDEAMDTLEESACEDLENSAIVDEVMELCRDQPPRGMRAASEAGRALGVRRLGNDEETLDQKLFRESAARSAGDWLALAALVLERAECTASESEAAALLLDVATIYRDEIGDLSGALMVLQKGLELCASHRESADFLIKLATDTDEWDTCIEVLADCAERMEPVEESAAGRLWVQCAYARICAGHGARRSFAVLRRVSQLMDETVALELNRLEDEAKDYSELMLVTDVADLAGDQEQVIRLLSRAISATSSPEQKAQCHHRIAKEEELTGDLGAAEWHWSEALRLFPNLHAARKALSALFLKKEEPRRAARLLEEARTCVEDRTQKVAFACDAAEIYKQELGENTRAFDLYAAALKVAPGTAKASLELIERYHGQERWSQLEPVVDRLLASPEARSIDNSQLGRVHYQAGDCAFHLGKFEKARDSYRACLRHDPRELRASLGDARSCIELSLYDQAVEAAERTLKLQRSQGQKGEELVEAKWLAGEASRKQGHYQRALDYYSHCVRYQHPEAMGALAGVYFRQGAYEKVVRLELKRAELVAEDKKSEVYLSIAKTYAEKLGEKQSAIRMCWKALKTDQEDRKVLHYLTVLYTQTKEWRSAIKTIVQMAHLENGAYRRARYLQAAGTIAREQNHIVEAEALLNKAIESYMADSVMSQQSEGRDLIMACFRQLVKMLSAQEMWKQVERNYRKMICRLEPGDPEVGRLWHALGLIYREKLSQPDAAIDSFEVAATLDEGRLTNHRILIDLYEGAGGDGLEKAIARRRLLLEKEPGNPEHLKALRSLYVRTKQMDRVWCVCRALVAMNQADDRELEFYHRSLPPEPRWSPSPLSAESWARITDSRVNSTVSSVFALVSEPLALVRATPESKAMITDVRDPSFDPLRRLFEQVSRAMGLHTFRCVIDPNRHEAVTLANLRDKRALLPTFVLGRSLYENRSIAHIVCVLTRHLFHGRRSFYLRNVAKGPIDLETIYYAAQNAAFPDLPVPRALLKEVTAIRDQIRPGLDHLRSAKLTQAFASMFDQNSVLDIRKWCEGVDATARHMAVLVSGDLVAALAMLQQEGMGPDEFHRCKTRLIEESISEEHMSLREELGITAPEILI